jgi:hypothetical protein
MSKNLNVDAITNELEGSAFFPRRPADPQPEEPKPVADPVPPRPLRTGGTPRTPRQAGHEAAPPV